MFKASMKKIIKLYWQIFKILNKWRERPYSQIRNLKIVSMFNYPQKIYQFSAIPTGCLLKLTG